MSRQSKNRRKLSLARQISATRKSGGSGAKSTNKTNKKVNVWWKKAPGTGRNNTARGSN